MSWADLLVVPRDLLQGLNIVKTGKLCHLHNPNHKSKSDLVTVICTGTNKTGDNCKNKTKNTDQLCYLHTPKKD